MGTGLGSLAKYSVDDFVLGFLKQSRAIVLNRFGLALIGRIAADRSGAEYVRRTGGTKRLRMSSSWFLVLSS